MPAWSRGHWATTQRRRPSQNIREFPIGRSVSWLARSQTGAAAVCPGLPDERCLLTRCSKSGRRLTDQRRQRVPTLQHTCRHLAPDVKGTEAPQKCRLHGPVLPLPPESWTIRRQSEEATEERVGTGIYGPRRSYRLERLVLGRSGPVHPAVPSLGSNGGTDGTAAFHLQRPRDHPPMLAGWQGQQARRNCDVAVAAALLGLSITRRARLASLGMAILRVELPLQDQRCLALIGH